MIKEDGQVIHFNNPKVQASLAANTFAITGHAETKRKLPCSTGIYSISKVHALSYLVIVYFYVICGSCEYASTC